MTVHTYGTGEMRKWLTEIQIVAENGETVNIWKVVTTPGGETGENVRRSVLYSRVRGRSMLRGGEMETVF